jgi:hypothetical protein
MNDQFYLTLPSDSSMDVFPNNKLCCFTAKLPQAFQLDHDAHWEVALVEIIHPTQIKNVSGNQTIFDVAIYNEKVQKELDAHDPEIGKKMSSKTDNTPYSTYRMRIPEGYYFSAQHLVETIAAVFEAQFGKALEKNQKWVEIKYHPVARRFLLQFLKGHEGKPFDEKEDKHLPAHERKFMTIGFSAGLFDILGGNKKYHGERTIHTNTDFGEAFRTPIELNVGLNLMFVYSDVVEYNVVGHTAAPLLRVIPFKVDTAAGAYEEGGNTFHVHREFVHPHYLPVSKSYFDSVNISIKGDLGQDVPFIDKGKVTVKLHFRKKQVL